VSNAGDSEAGTFDIPRATWESVNTAYIQIEEKTGYTRPAAIARALGVTRFPLRAVPSFVLGTNEVSPLDMASAYATLAARGTYCAPIGITEVTDATGRVLGKVGPRCRAAMSPRTADTVTAILRGVIDHGTGKGAVLGRPAAGKTGTTNGPTAAWFDGYTPDFAGVVWMGYPTDPARHPLRGVHGKRVVYGGTFAAPIWRAIMLAAHEGVPVRDFVAPPVTAAPRAPVSPTPSPGAVPPPPACHGKHCKH
jgi:membrane peptidoglycan carboxypeptidase